MHCLVDDNLSFDVDWKLLHSPAAVVEPTEDIAPLVNKLLYGVSALNGVGLAAPQIGELKRIFVARFSSFLYIFVNPVLVRHGRDTVTATEGCLSTNGHVVQVERWQIVEVQYEQLPTRRVVTDRLTGLDARIVQHELDHLDGKLIVDLLP